MYPKIHSRHSSKTRGEGSFYWAVRQRALSMFLDCHKTSLGHTGDIKTDDVAESPECLVTMFTTLWNGSYSAWPGNMTRRLRSWAAGHRRARDGCQGIISQINR